MEPKDQIKFKCAELQQSLEKQEPGYKNLLQEIHEQIRTVPELVYVLSDEEIATVVSGLSKFTGIVISETKSKEKITKAKAAKLSVDDI